MTTLADFMILSGNDNRPPILEKDLYDSWKSIMKLYMQNKEHGRVILESVEHGPLIWPMIEKNGVIMIKKYEELSATKKIQADCDLKETNIILQGLPSDVYSLVNHHKVSKDLWERVQLLMQGTLLTKQEMKCKMYDAFDKFAHIKGESIHQYYLRFTQLINDMNIYKIKLEQFLVNTKFLNSLLPECIKFVMDVKLVRDLHTTNFDQLHAYLQQHELHANEDRLMRERNQDPLALVANHQMTPSDFNTYQSSYNNPWFQQQFSPSQSSPYGSIHPTQHYSTTYSPTPLAITYPSAPYLNAYSSTVHQDAYPQPQSILQIEYSVSTINQQTYLAQFTQINSGLVVLVFKQGDDPIDAINKMMSFMSTIGNCSIGIGRQSSFDAGTSGTRANISGTRGNNLGQQRVVNCFNCQREGFGKVLNEEELAFFTDPEITEGPDTQTIITHNASYQAHDLDAYDSDYDEISTTKAYLLKTRNAAIQDTNSSTQQDAMILSMFEQLSNQVTNCNKVNKDNLMANESLSAKLERYKERIKLLEGRQNMDLSTRKKLIIDDIIQDKNAQFSDFEKEINSLKQTLSEQLKEKESLTTTFNIFKNEFKEKEAKNIDKEIALEKKVKELDNIVYKIERAFELRPCHFTYPEKRLMMEEMLYKFIDEEKREQEEMRAFIYEFRTTNERLFKERNNSLSELRFEVQGLLRAINNTPIPNHEVKGVSTRGGKTKTQDVQYNDTNIHTKEPVVINQDEPVESNEVLTKDQLEKDKQEKDKIRTKPDKNERRGKTRRCQNSVTVKKAEKEKKIQTKGTKNRKP
nr:hypothetical protein [Tanacetum cinerariifolium]